MSAVKATLESALGERNRLAHSFYRQHNNRRNTPDGCAIMLADLEDIHKTVLDAYRDLLLLRGVDIYESEPPPLELPTKHFQI